MALVNFDLTRYDTEFLKTAMNRVEKAADVIRDNAKRILKGKLKGNWVEHGPYTHRRKKGKLIDFEASIWTERTKGAMVDSIRVVRREGKNDVWVMAGNYKTWWAVQLEYGHAGWRGGKKSFLRPAMKNAESRIIGILEGGAIGSKEVHG